MTMNRPGFTYCQKLKKTTKEYKNYVFVQLFDENSSSYI